MHMHVVDTSFINQKISVKKLNKIFLFCLVLNVKFLLGTLFTDYV